MYWIMIKLPCFPRSAKSLMFWIELSEATLRRASHAVLHFPNL
jgi:hypothetical protein